MCIFVCISIICSKWMLDFDSMKIHRRKMMLMRYSIKLDNWELLKDLLRLLLLLRVPEALQELGGCFLVEKVFQLLLLNSLTLWLTPLSSGLMVSPLMMVLWGSWMIQTMLLFSRYYTWTKMSSCLFSVWLMFFCSVEYSKVWVSKRAWAWR